MTQKRKENMSCILFFGSIFNKETFKFRSFISMFSIYFLFSSLYDNFIKAHEVGGETTKCCKINRNTNVNNN